MDQSFLGGGTLDARNDDVPASIRLRIGPRQVCPPFLSAAARQLSRAQDNAAKIAAYLPRGICGNRGPVHGADVLLGVMH